MAYEEATVNTDMLCAKCGDTGEVDHSTLAHPAYCDCPAGRAAKKRDRRPK